MKVLCAASNTCHGLFLCEAIVNIPAPLPPTGSEPPIFESAIPLCVEVTSQNSLHCAAAIERLDTDTAPPASPFRPLEITPMSHGAEKEGKNLRKWTESWGYLEANGRREVGWMAACESGDVGRPAVMGRDRQRERK